MPVRRTSADAETESPPLEKSWRGLTAYAIGHSTHPIPEFIEMLRGHGVKVLVDVRGIPRSRAQPQFNGDVLGAELRKAKIRYLHLSELGGRRYGFGKWSPNSAWQNTGFRGYADHMMSEEFEVGIEKLRQLALAKPVAFMCAEGMRWRCHRALIADVLVVRGAEVFHIESKTRAVPHRVTRLRARVAGTRGLPADGRSASLKVLARWAGERSAQSRSRVVRARPCGSSRGT